MIVIVAGVSGSGKTTVGALLAGRLGWPFTDGDLLHPAANIAKMAGGVPLTDEDRLPWLQAIGALMDTDIAAGQPAVLACSALRRSYRDLLLAGRPAARMAFLDVARQVAADRLAARHGHFFRPALLDSQFAALEPPGADEPRVIVVPVAGRPEEIAGEIVRKLGLAADPSSAGQPGPPSAAEPARSSARDPGPPPGQHSARESTSGV